MKKIVHFGKFYLPDKGGIESVTASLARGATKFGYKVLVICFQKGLEHGVEIIDEVELYRAPATLTVRSQPLSIKYFSLCLKQGRDSDLVHLHMPNMLAAICCLLLKRKTPLIVHWHSDVIDKGALGLLVRPLESALLRRAACIIATSKAYSDASLTLGPYAQKTTVLPIGIADVDFKVNYASDMTDSLNALLLKIGNKKIILSVGRLVPYKGYAVLIRSAVSLPDNCVIVIVGSGDLEASLRLLIEDLGVNDKVHLVGRVPDSVLHFLFSRAEIYCMSSNSRAEAFGVVLLEAMAHGVPVVATDIFGSGVSWVNEHEVSGLNVPINDHVAISDACCRILNSTELHGKLSAGARKRFLTEFTESKSVNRVIKLYRKILD